MDRNLRAFLSVARKGNLTAASEEIGLTQPAVTKTIRRLESDLGAELFERTARGMFLNDAGKRFLRRAESIEAQYRFASEEMAVGRRHEKPVLRIVAGVAYQTGIAAQLAGLLHTEFPDTLIDLRAGHLEPSLPALSTGEIDIVLGSLIGQTPEGIVNGALLNVEIAVFAGPQNPLFGRDKVSLEETAPHPWVTFHRDESTISRLTLAFSDMRLPPPRIGMIAHGVEASLDIVRTSVALTAGAHPIQPMAEARGLRRLPLPAPLWSFESGYWLRASSLGYPVVSRAVAILQTLCAAQSHEFPS